MASGSILRASAALGLVEAAHDGQGDWQSWCERLLEATQRFLSCRLVNLGVLRRHEQRYECVASTSTVPSMRDLLRGQVARISPAEMDPFARYPALFNATLKLGLGSRTELVGLAGRLLGTPRAGAREPSLTAAERDVLSLVRMGYTNAGIAAARQRSERTVANQVASLLKKLDAPSRRAPAAG